MLEGVLQKLFLAHLTVVVDVHLFQALLCHLLDYLVGNLVIRVSLLPHVLSEQSHHPQHLGLVDEPTVVNVDGREDLLDESLGLSLVGAAGELDEVFSVKFIHFY